MSYEFHCLLIHGERKQIQSEFATLRPPFSLLLDRFSDSLFAVFSDLHAEAPAPNLTQEDFDREWAFVVAKLSPAPNGAVDYYYNSIAGSFIRRMVAGEPVQHYTENDNSLWVPADEDGAPIEYAEPCLGRERSSNRTYVCLISALGLALKAIGEIVPSLDEQDLRETFHARRRRPLRQYHPRKK